jgi:hypothetical protein
MIVLQKEVVEDVGEVDVEGEVRELRKFVHSFKWRPNSTMLFRHLYSNKKTVCYT